jgi:hypothetical protein
MGSQLQNEANRRNAVHSNGPKTEEGKAASSKNSLKHGLLSRNVLLPAEDAEAFAQLGERFMAALGPVGELELVLVDRIIGLIWRLRRLGEIEAGILAGLGPFKATVPTLGDAFMRDSANANALSKLSRYETSMERSLYKALHELERRQAARQGKDVPVPLAVDIDVSGVEPQAVGNTTPPIS